MSDFSVIEKRISALEEKTPLEVRVVVSYLPFFSGIGGMRLTLLVLLSLTLSLDRLWIPFPLWICLVVCIIFIFVPLHWYNRIPGGRRFLTKSEKRSAIAHQAHGAFHDLRMGAKSNGHALLLFFSVPDRQFFILPDAKISDEWPAEEWHNLSHDLAAALGTHKEPNHGGIIDACIKLLDTIETKALQRLGPRLNTQESNELENSVVILK